MRAPFLRQGGGLWIEGGDVQLTSCNIYSNEAGGVSACPKTRAPSKPEHLPFPGTFFHRPDGSTFLEPSERMRASFRQGGGLFIEEANVQLTNCNIYSNDATYVSTRPNSRARHQNPSTCHRPPELTPFLRLCVAVCTSSRRRTPAANRKQHTHTPKTRAPTTPEHLSFPGTFFHRPDGSTFLAPSESERRSSGRAAASTSTAATCSSPAATSTRTRRPA